MGGEGLQAYNAELGWCTMEYSGACGCALCDMDAVGIYRRFSYRQYHFIRGQKGHSAQSDLFWSIQQNAAMCYLLLFLYNWGV